MSRTFHVTDAHHPILLTVYPTRMTTAALPDYHASYERILERGEPFASLVDMRPCLEMPSGEVRKAMAEWGEKVAGARERLVVAVAFLVTNPLVRGALTAVHWQAPPRQPTVVVETPDQALDFLGERLLAAGLGLPGSLPALRAWLETKNPRSGAGS